MSLVKFRSGKSVPEGGGGVALPAGVTWRPPWAARQECGEGGGTEASCGWGRSGDTIIMCETFKAAERDERSPCGGIRSARRELRGASLPPGRFSPGHCHITTFIGAGTLHYPPLVPSTPREQPGRYGR
ncbi:hypothetical protein E2C01_034735 [Portunus trituberculatus]|uniref:Uncharacterized protein n=1 Tax=Portunus trituberculatus TaxID=210409 RepID=A0A5B7F1C2_PORTR|nr:hypothetical protein [Portunus trituberculatus]